MANTQFVKFASLNLAENPEKKESKIPNLKYLVKARYAQNAKMNFLPILLEIEEICLMAKILFAKAAKEVGKRNGRNLTQGKRPDAGIKIEKGVKSNCGCLSSWVKQNANIAQKIMWHVWIFTTKIEVKKSTTLAILAHIEQKKLCLKKPRSVMLCAPIVIENCIGMQLIFDT